SSTFATLSFHRRDRVRFLQFPKIIYQNVEPVLLAAWAPGIQTQSFYGEAYEYQLKESPFGARGDVAGVASRRLVRDLLAYLYTHSWLIVTPLSHSRRIGCKDTLIFRQKLELGLLKTAEPLPPTPVEWLVVALQGAGGLRIIYDGDGTGRKDGLGVLLDGLKKAWDGIGAAQTGDWNQDSFEFRLSDKPWRAHREATMKARSILLRLVETLDSLGWQSYVTIRQRTENDDVKKTDTWYFVRPR
ncbi:hypothetical protein GQ53DRAFT_599068, partial [Thozetella sp. PMI_491]